MLLFITNHKKEAYETAEVVSCRRGQWRRS